MKQLWTIAEIVEISGFTERTVRGAIGRADRGEPGLVALRVAGASRRVRHSALVDWLGYDPLTEPDIHYRPTTRKPRRKTPDPRAPKLFET